MSGLNELLPEYVTEIRPEIENLPDVVYGKSIAGTCFETDLYMAMGSTAMSYAMLMEDYEPMAWHGRMLEAFAARRGFWQTLREINLRTHPAGIRVFTPAEGWKQTAAPHDPPLAWAKPNAHPEAALLRFGVPLARSKKEDHVILLHGALAAQLSDAEIGFLLSRPVFTDGEALEILEKRGWGEHFSARAAACDTSQLYESMLNHPVNGAPNKPAWSQNFFVTRGHYLTDLTGGTQFLTEYASRSRNAAKNTSDPNHPYGMASAIVRTSKGAHWAVFGNSPWLGSAVSHDRRTQLLNAMDHISGGGLAARLETPWQAAVLPRADQDGRTVSVGIVNCTIGESDPLTVRIRRPAANRFYWHTPTGEPSELDVRRDGEDAIVITPPLAPWSGGLIC